MVRGVRPVLQASVQAALRALHFRGMIAPNNSFNPNPLRTTNNMAGKACHVVGSTTQVGLTQALGLNGRFAVNWKTIFRFALEQIGRASVRERVCQEVMISVVAGSK